jgi:DNA-binding NtrC family response regulator
VRIVDPGSTNGTLVDGVRVFDAELRPGAVVRVGSTLFRTEVGDEPVFVQLSSRSFFGDLVGTSAEMRRVYALMDRVAPTDSTVLITGETGTGKEMVARGIHEASPRAGGPFVTVDCGAIAQNLIESELFGHVRGSFTGATSDRAGLFEEAEGGTLFLDEIGELPLELQPKLLRVLETRTVRRVGGGATRRADVRVLSATNRELSRQVNDGAFREDLYYRLAVVELALPPLRNRAEDIPLLAAHFCERFGAAPDALPANIAQSLTTRSWPGNVRELRNFVERSLSLGWPALRTGSVPPPNASLGGDPIVPSGLPLREARVAWAERFESAYVRALLERTAGNVTRAAELAGVNRRTFQRLMSASGVRAPNEDE